MKSPTARPSTTFGIMTILITFITIITTVAVGLSVTAAGIVIAIGDIAQIHTDHTLIADAHGEDADRIDQNTANTFGSIANIIIMNRESNREDLPGFIYSLSLATLCTHTRKVCTPNHRSTCVPDRRTKRRTNHRSARSPNHRSTRTLNRGTNHQSTNDGGTYNETSIPWMRSVRLRDIRLHVSDGVLLFEMQATWLLRMSLGIL